MRAMSIAVILVGLAACRGSDAPADTRASPAPTTTLLLAQGQSDQSNAHTPPWRGAPDVRVGGASLDVTEHPRIALVIGNGAYQYLPRLTNPAEDARLMAATLQSVGFELIGGQAQVDLDRAGFERVIREFGRALANTSVGLFYYAGHGLQLQGVNYLIPVTANPETTADVDLQLINASTVLREMEAADSRLNIVILDACRNNPFGGRGLRNAGGGLAQMLAPRGTLISYATQPGNVAIDGTTGHSPYTAALAEAIRRPGVPILEVFNQVGLAVDQATASRQQPWVALSPLEGTFYFVAPVEVKTAPPSPDPETVFWQTIAQSGNAADFEEYLRDFPQGHFAVLARNRLAALRPTMPATPMPDGRASQFAAVSQRPPALPPLERIRGFAAERSMPLPPDLEIIPPTSDVAPSLARFSGTWSGDNRWNGDGRQGVIVIEAIASSGLAMVVYAYGPPNPHTYNQDPARWHRATGTIDRDTISFEYAPGFRLTLTLYPDGQRMFAVLEPNPELTPPFPRGSMWLFRIS
jgi:hypothetical protein